jgi:hypothetical protein
MKAEGQHQTRNGHPKAVITRLMETHTSIIVFVPRYRGDIAVGTIL